jgi:hypothetical protein
MEAYEDVIRHTSHPHAPWYVVPANAKWFTRLVVAAAVIRAMQGLKLEFPDVDPGKRRELAAARAALLEEAPKKARRARRRT